MGEAKRRLELAAKAAQVMAGLNPGLVAQAVSQVVRSKTDHHGADCLLFAVIGAGVLRRLGVEADPVAGSAIWRVGPGDTDTVSHARELTGTWFKQALDVPAPQFHAWVKAPGLLADFSTCTLRLKAAQLDAADGGTTTVEWAPEYLWLTGPRPPEHLATPSAVNQALKAGVYSYVQHADIEAMVRPVVRKLEEELGTAIAVALTTYHALCAGNRVQVVRVGEDGMQSEPVSHPVVAVPGDLPA